MHIAIADTEVPATSRRERKKIEVKNALIREALALFAKNGLEQTTLDEICDASDIARRTFYNHFPSKQALVTELCDRFLVQQTEKIISQSLSQSMTTMQRLQHYFDYIAGQARLYGDVERDLLMQLLLQIPASQDESRNLLLLLQRQFRRIFDAGVEAADYSSAYSADFLAEMVVAALNNAMCNWVHDPAFPIDQRLRAIPEFVLR